MSFTERTELTEVARAYFDDIPEYPEEDYEREVPASIAEYATEAIIAELDRLHERHLENMERTDELFDVIDESRRTRAARNYALRKAQGF